MRRPSILSRIPENIPQLVLLLLLVPIHASAQERFTLGLGAGPASQYTWRSYSILSTEIEERFDITWHGMLGLGYSLSPHVSLQADAGYLGYKERNDPIMAMSSTGYPGIPLPITSTLSSAFPSLGTGVRFYPAGPTTTRPRAYVQFVPTLYLTHWTERREQAGNVTENSFTQLQPGFAAGLGLVGFNQAPVRLDLGVRYYYSPDLANKDLGSSSGDFQGLRQFAMVVALYKPL